MVCLGHPQLCRKQECGILGETSRFGLSPAHRPGGRRGFLAPGCIGDGWARSSASRHPGAKGGLSGLRPIVPAQAGAQPPGVWAALASDQLGTRAWAGQASGGICQQMGTTGQLGHHRGYAELVVPGPPQRAGLVQPLAGGPGPPEPPSRSPDSAGPEQEEGPLLATLRPWLCPTSCSLWVHLCAARLLTPGPGLPSDPCRAG